MEDLPAEAAVPRPGTRPAPRAKARPCDASAAGGEASAGGQRPQPLDPLAPGETAGRTDALPESTGSVAYRRGGHRVPARAAVRPPAGRGRRAIRRSDGPAERRPAQLPVDAAEPVCPARSRRLRSTPAGRSTWTTTPPPPSTRGSPRRWRRT
ncbi:hypothetical protein GCM10010421_55660 [Streptomyces glaucus]|uniref:Secreted protein n=1 Tax=Streptomyces glaucus TaxID=284029 RepID=A0ABP5XGH9_9ACTN